MRRSSWHRKPYLALQVFLRAFYHGEFFKLATRLCAKLWMSKGRYLPWFDHAWGVLSLRFYARVSKLDQYEAAMHWQGVPQIRWAWNQGVQKMAQLLS